MTPLAKFIWKILGSIVLAVIFTVVIIASVAAAGFAIYGLGAIAVLIAWNLGVIGGASAIGLLVGKIGFWTAFGISALTYTLRYILGGSGLAYELAQTSYYKASTAFLKSSSKEKS